MLSALLPVCVHSFALLYGWGARARTGLWWILVWAILVCYLLDKSVWYRAMLFWIRIVGLNFDPGPEADNVTWISKCDESYMFKVKLAQGKTCIEKLLFTFDFGSETRNGDGLLTVVLSKVPTERLLPTKYISLRQWPVRKDWCSEKKTV